MPARAARDAPCARLSEWTWKKIIGPGSRPGTDASARRRPFRFCPVCGGALESRCSRPASPSGSSASRAGSSSISTPSSPSARSSATSDDRIVLVKRAIEPGYGKWVFPGRLRRPRRGSAGCRDPRGARGSGPRRPDRSTPEHLLVSRPHAGDHRLCGDDDRGACLRATTRGSRRGSSSRTRFRGTTWRFAARRKRCGSSWRRVCPKRFRPGVQSRSRDRDFLRQIDVLDRVQQRDAFLHRTLERLAAGDQAHAAGALVDDGGLHRFLQVALARRRAAGVDQPARPM